MKEVEDHIVYKQLKSKFERIDLDYVIMSIDSDYEGVETHKRAVIKAFSILNARSITGSLDESVIGLEEEKMRASLSSMEELLQLPEDNYYENRRKKYRAFSKKDPIPYWFAFLEPPHGNSFLTKDFIDFNALLFPNVDDCEVYRWNDDFSDYFEAGKEWWGTGLWSIYDHITGLIVIIGASLTD